jgi:hypothetical protein
VILQRTWPIIAASINLALSTDTIIRHDEQRNRRLHRELVAVILDNRQREVITAVHEHIQTSAAELLGLCTPGSIGTGGSAIRPATGNGRARGGRSRSA